MIVALAGCGGGGTAPDGSSEKFRSLDELVGLDPKSSAERSRKIQELVATCMKRQGFDYVVHVSSDAFGDSSMVIPTPGADGARGDAFRKSYGYGITVPPAMAASPEAAEDPNEVIREAMTPRDREAYERALVGDSRAEASQGETSERLPQRGDEVHSGGCYREAETVVRPPPHAHAYYEEMAAEVDADPRLIDAREAWATCMASRGFSRFETSDEIFSYLFEQNWKINGVDPDNPSSGPELERTPLPAEDPRLAELQREEIRIAQADHGCARKSKLRVVEKKVIQEVQRRFLDDHPEFGG